MTQDELITVARSHTVDFPKLTGEPWANQETLSKVTVVDTVVVSFESDEYPRKIMILLEKETGNSSPRGWDHEIPSEDKRLICKDGCLTVVPRQVVRSWRES